LVGTGFVVWFLSSLAPRLLRVDLKAESRQLEAQLAGGAGADSASTAYREWDVRAYRLPDAVAGRTVLDVERACARARVSVERIRRGATTFAATPDTVLQQGDNAAVTARRHVLLAENAPFGVEVEDRRLLEFPTAVRDVVITRGEVAERTLA